MGLKDRPKVDEIFGSGFNSNFFEASEEPRQRQNDFSKLTFSSTKNRGKKVSPFIFNL